MSMPTIPDINPDINICRDDAINILLASIGLEQMSLAELMKAESLKLREVLRCTTNPCEIKELNKSIESLLKVLVTYETILQSKLRDVMELAQCDEMGPSCCPQKEHCKCQSNKNHSAEAATSHHANEGGCKCQLNKNDSNYTNKCHNYCKQKRCNPKKNGETTYTNVTDNDKPFYSSYGYDNITICNPETSKLFY